MINFAHRLFYLSQIALFEFFDVVGAHKVGFIQDSGSQCANAVNREASQLAAESLLS
jgi:hypothetical protein